MKTYLLTAVLWMVSGLTASAATILLTPSNASPEVGSVFTVSLEVTGNTGEILGFGFDSQVSTPAIIFQGLAIDPFFGSDLGLQPGTQVSAFAFPGATGSKFTLVTFSFLANSVGSSEFSVISDLSDPNEGLFDLNAPTATDLSRQIIINVQAVTDVPEPSTFGLAVLGIAAVFLARRTSR